MACTLALRTEFWKEQSCLLSFSEAVFMWCDIDCERCSVEKINTLVNKAIVLPNSEHAHFLTWAHNDRRSGRENRQRYTTVPENHGQDKWGHQRSTTSLCQSTALVQSDGVPLVLWFTQPCMMGGTPVNVLIVNKSHFMLSIPF